MSIKPFRATSVVEFDCSPRPEGMACIAFGLLFAVIMSLYFIINGVKTAFGAVLVYAMAAALRVTAFTCGVSGENRSGAK